MSKDSSDVKCPLCGEIKKKKGLFFHFRNNHAKEFNELGYAGIMDMAEESPAPPKKAPTPALGRKTNREIDQNITENTEEEVAFGAWNRMSKQKIWFNPSPSGAAMINEFGNVSNPSDIINKALVEYGRSRGIQHAVLKTEGGKALTLIGDGANEDRDFGRLLKLMQLNATQNQSYSQFSPTVQMMQAMRDKVNRGISMKEFMQSMVQMRMQESMTSNKANNPMTLLLLMNRLMKKRR